MLEPISTCNSLDPKMNASGTTTCRLTKCDITPVAVETCPPKTNTYMKYFLVIYIQCCSCCATSKIPHIFPKTRTLDKLAYLISLISMRYLQTLNKFGTWRDTFDTNNSILLLSLLSTHYFWTRYKNTLNSVTPILQSYCFWRLCVPVKKSFRSRCFFNYYSAKLFRKVIQAWAKIMYANNNLYTHTRKAINNVVDEAKQSRKTPQIPDQTALVVPEMIQFWIMYVHFDVNFLSDTAQCKYLNSWCFSTFP